MSEQRRPQKGAAKGGGDDDGDKYATKKDLQEFFAQFMSRQETNATAAARGRSGARASSNARDTAQGDSGTRKSTKRGRSPDAQSQQGNKKPKARHDTLAEDGQGLQVLDADGKLVELRSKGLMNLPTGSFNMKRLPGPGGLQIPLVKGAPMANVRAETGDGGWNSLLYGGIGGLQGAADIISAQNMFPNRYGAMSYRPIPPVLWSVYGQRSARLMRRQSSSLKTTTSIIPIRARRRSLRQSRPHSQSRSRCQHPRMSTTRFSAAGASGGAMKSKTVCSQIGDAAALLPVQGATRSTGSTDVRSRGR